MPRARPLKYRVLRKRLREFGFKESKQRGPGSERVFYHENFRGQRRFYSVTHHGDNIDVLVGQLEALRRHFGLTKEELYG